MSAWADEARLVLGQCQVDDKSNEITAIPELLEMLVLEGCIVTIDAMGCYTRIAQTIRDRGADYVLALKDNQPPWHEAVVETFTVELAEAFEGCDHDFHKTVNKASRHAAAGRNPPEAFRKTEAEVLHVGGRLYNCSARLNTIYLE